MHNIDEKDLLKANATIIPGILVLLTLTASFSSVFDRLFTFWDVLTVSSGTMPFAASSIILLEDHSNRDFWFRLSKRLTSWGLIFLIAIIAGILGLSEHGSSALG
jgi:hypothetical protein